MFLNVKEGKILSSENINPERQLEIDLAKAFSLIGMVYSHTFENSGFDFSSSIYTALIVNYFGGFLGAPLFMTFMGFGIFYSNKTTPKKLFNKGIVILFIGYLLNVFKYFIPNLILGNTNSLLIPLLNLDILQFAGLGLILFSFLLKVGCSDILMLIIGIIFNIVGSIFNRIPIDNIFLSKILGLFIGTENVSHFPLLNWFIFIPAGYILGEIYIHIKNKDLFYKKIGIPLLLFGLILSISEFVLDIGFIGSDRCDYYFISTADVLISLIALMGFMTLYYLFSKIFHKRILDVLQTISKNMIFYYITHIVLIRFVVFLLLKVTLGITFTPLLMYLIATILAIITYYISLFLKEKTKTV